jgi:hypothetical protein
VKTHPLAIPTHPRIDVCFGGHQERIIKDTFTLVRQALRYLSAGEHVLYMNTLASKKHVEEVADAISARHAAKIAVFAESGNDLMERLKMLTLMIQAKNVRVVVLNSFDFATQNSRQRLAIVHWVRTLRDDLGVRVIIYSLHRPGDFGAMGQLKLIADSIEETADWRKAPPQSFEQGVLNTTATLKAILSEVEVTTPEGYKQHSRNSGTGTSPLLRGNNERMGVPVTLASQKYASDPLIYNDLEVMTAREEVEVEEGEMVCV